METQAKISINQRISKSSNRRINRRIIRKKYRITNRFRFICFVLSVFLFIASIIGFTFNKADGTDKVIYTEVVVSEGDTLWALAGEYGTKDKDIRAVIYDICKINNISADELMPGQKLLIPSNM